MKFDMKIGNSFILKNKKVATIIGYTSEYRMNMPWKTDIFYKNKVKTLVYFDDDGCPNYSSEDGYSIEKQTNRKDNPEYFI